MGWQGVNVGEDTRKSFSGVSESCGRRSAMVLEEEKRRALQWCLNVCESGFSNEGVTEAMNESACLCGSVGSLLTPSATSAFVPEVVATVMVMWDWETNHVGERKSNMHCCRDKALCSLFGSEQKGSPVIGVFTLEIGGLLFATRATQSIRIRPQEVEVNWREIVFLCETCPSPGGKLDQKWNFRLLLTFSWEPNVAEEALEPLHRMHRNCSLCLRSCLTGTRFQIKQPFLVKQLKENTMSKYCKHLAELGGHPLRLNL